MSEQMRHMLLGNEEVADRFLGMLHDTLKEHYIVGYTEHVGRQGFAAICACTYDEQTRLVTLEFPTRRSKREAAADWIDHIHRILVFGHQRYGCPKCQAEGPIQGDYPYCPACGATWVPWPISLPKSSGKQ